MDEETLQEINNGILGMRQLLYADIIYAKDFIKCIKNYNKKHNLKLKTENMMTTKDLISYRYFKGYYNNQNIYSIPVLTDYLEEN